MKDIPLEIEKKMIILMPDVARLLECDGYTVSQITQTYLSSDPGVTHRVRMREYEGSVVYTETKKVRIDKLSVYEDERELTEGEYLSLLALADPARHPVKKTRHTVEYEGYTLEIDIYPEWKRSCILEIEMESRDAKPLIPDFIRVVLDVTGNKRFSNAQMALAFPDEVV